MRLLGVASVLVLGTLLIACSADPSVPVNPQTNLLVVNTQSLSAATYGSAYSDVLASSGGTSGYSWSLATGSTLPPGLTLSAGGTLSGTPTAAGTYNFTIAVSDISSPPQTARQALSLTVNKAALTVTADNKMMTYGLRPPALTTAGYSGFVNGDTAATVSGSPSVTTAVTSFTAAGSYPIIVAAGTLSATNYTFSFVNGALTVNPAPLIVPDRGNNRVLIYSSPFSSDQSASVVLGQTGPGTATAATTQAGMSGPVAATFDNAGNLYVSESGGPGANCRVTQFQPPFVNGGMNASIVIGQTDFVTGSCEAGGVPAAGSFCQAGIAVDANGNLWVADANSNRVLQFAAPLSSGMSATVVIGQANFTSASSGVSSTNLQAPVGIAFDSSGNLWVADTSNNRVLQFTPPFTINMAATLVLGQPDFDQRPPNDDPITGTISARTFNGPQGLVFDGSGNLWVSDTANNRVLQFSPPFSNDMSASLVLGQANPSGNSANQGGTATIATLSSPKGLYFNGATLFVGDTANNRTLGFTDPLINGVDASLVLGQSDGSSIAANQGGGATPTATSQSDPFDAGASPLALCVLAGLIAGWFVFTLIRRRLAQPVRR